MGGDVQEASGTSAEENSENQRARRSWLLYEGNDEIKTRMETVLSLVAYMCHK